MPALYSITTRASGTILTAAIYNADHQNHVNFGDAAHLGGFSANASQMQQAVNPGDVGSESLALSISDELTRVRYIIAKMRGTDFWYRSPNLAVQLGSSNDVGRNLLHNPLFNIQQRGSGPWTVGQYTADRWNTAVVVDTASYSVVAMIDGARTAIGDEAAQFTMQVGFTGNAGATAVSYLQQRIENMRRLAGKTVTFSFWATASVALKLGINGAQYFGTGGSPSAAINILATGLSINATTSWARYSVTFAIPSIVGKTLGTNNDHYTSVQIYFSSGANNNAIAGNIGVQSGTVQLWGVQLEVGSVATPLEKIDPQQDLAKCQRFYALGQLGACGYASAAGQPSGTMAYFPVTMRAIPGVTVGSAIGADTNVTAGAAVDTIGQDSFRYSLTSAGVGATFGARAFTASADL
jgi:hypothetical protein